MTHASLFSGIGGPEVAATMLGWDNLFHCEINDFGRKILDYWYPNSKSYEDITKTDFSEWRGKVNVLTGGFPCQPFSYAGKRRGADDDRYLWPFMFKAIDQIRPTWVVAENVTGIITMVEQGEVVEVGGQASMFEEVDGLHRYRLTETFTLQRICDDLEGHGYSVQPVLVPACSVGAPHRRNRVFIVARRSSSETDNTRDRTSDRESGRVRKAMDGKRENITLYGTCRQSGGNVATDTASDGRNGCTCKDWPKRCNYGDTERIEKEDTDGFGLRCESRTAGIGTTSTDTSCSGTGTPGESAGFEGCRRRDDDEQEERREPSEWSYGFYELLWNTADTGRERVQARHSGRKTCKPDRNSSARVVGGNSKRVYEYQIGERWDSFPTVSPVHRGNDGIPFDVDSLSIPFSKWRTESLKAYGNAIVPQVMYEIFRAIELTENQSL